jgi:Radical SAM superfamily
MFVHNVRYGFATNSSSTHSIVLLQKDTRVSDDIEEGCFGWDFFTCASEEAKRLYLAQTVASNFSHLYKMPAEEANIIATKWCGVEADLEGYIDHQSLITLPTKAHFDHYTIRKDFFEDLMKFILRPDIAVLGGNDNSEDTHPLIASGNATNLLQHRYWDEIAVGSPTLKLLREGYGENVRARYDQTGQFWTMFNTTTGTKVRFSFVADANSEKSEAPELIDIKITDYCKKGCYYCYQGSVPSGKHASKEDLRYLSYALADLEVFEVALGGGEPTEHPDLLEIITDFHYAGMVVNLTTRNVDWIVANYKALEGRVGAIGLSVDSCSGLVDSLSKLTAAIPQLNWDGHLKLSVQIVVGSCSKADLVSILETCRTFHITVVLLGWKYTHRGAKGPKEEIDLPSVLDMFWGPAESNHKHSFKYAPKKEAYIPWRGPSISFDTTLVNQTKEWLEKNANKWNFTTREGAHSMYIDCVNGTMHRSSYDNEGGESIKYKDDGRHTSYALHIKNFFATL